MQFDPFEVLPLANGGEVWVACYDGVNLALETDERDEEIVQDYSDVR
ncbi:hypothetical protein HMPREF0298_1905 [Corynebacterium lipophiloflavum DSM 44291]|uniref:Uncharacterized protein n=1 Tax=Corynebacterium lipophiloflavum (strain ATCC 700352 / DSM 44291 / CCUG 37336 / JCM 10383 / DMMZ 1944) TaxID=525263 RepID=C0XTY5_CORLD|nr:hypothetical protein HMPREF0298_1905 [Corynebacterium lipophiloflavum DSM 44291]